MTTTRAPLTDADLRSVLLELAAGPDAGRLTTDVLRAIGATPQRRPLIRPLRPFLVDRRRLMLVAIAAMLAVALVGTLLSGAINLNRLLAVPARPMHLVVQQWNRLAPPDSVITHTAFAPGKEGGTLMAGLPENVVGVRWSPDARRVAYFPAEITMREGGLSPGPRMTTGAPSIANADGSGATALPIPHPVGSYIASAWFGGALWAPDSRHVALSWNTGECVGSTDCVPPSGIDIFDADGRLVLALDTPNNVSQSAYWSGDGRHILWTTGTCVGGSCIDDTVHWRAIEGDPTVTSFAAVAGGFVWPEDARIHATTFDRDGGTGIITVAPDGSDLRLIDWDSPSRAGLWSWDGRMIVDVDSQNALLWVYDVATGTAVTHRIPPDSYVGSWSPDSTAVALVGPPPDETTGASAFYTLTIEDGILAGAGVGTDVTWAPASLVP